MKRTKIVATLGPKSDSITEIKDLVEAGMNVARLNFSHGTYEHHKKMINHVREVSKQLNKPIALIIDLQGPKIRIGEIKEPGITIKRGQIIILSTKNTNNSKFTIPIQYKHLAKDLKKNNKILIDDGLIELKVISTTKNTIKTKVIVGGTIKSHKGINVPSATIKAKSITKKDIADLKFALQFQPEYIALSFVKSAQDIIDLKKIIKMHCKVETYFNAFQPQIIAKIERWEAVYNLEEIAKEADGLMVARGDLAIEIGAEKVPIIQRKIISLANKLGKPVITATQMLASMTDNPCPTRAEISDIATAIFENTDAVMLSNETSTGKYSSKAVQIMCKTIKETEKEIKKHGHLQRFTMQDNEISNALAYSASILAKNINAHFIINFTNTGYLAKEIAKYRCFTPIITFTNSKMAFNSLSLIWGLNKIYYVNEKKYDQKNRNFEEKIINFIKNKEKIKKGQNIIFCYSFFTKKYLSTFTI